jgi:hypothetical protein
LIFKSRTGSPKVSRKASSWGIEIWAIEASSSGEVLSTEY